MKIYILSHGLYCTLWMVPDVYLNAVWHRLNWIQCCRTILMILNSERRILSTSNCFQYIYKTTTYAHMHIHIQKHLQMTSTQTQTQPLTYIHRWMKILHTNIYVNSVNVNECHTADRNIDYCMCIENLHFPSTGKSLPYRFWYSILPQFQVKFIFYLWTATVNSKHGGKRKVSGIKLRYNDYFRYAYNMSINMNFYLHSIRQFRHDIMPCTTTSKAFKAANTCFWIMIQPAAGVHKASALNSQAAS